MWKGNGNTESNWNDCPSGSIVEVVITYIESENVLNAGDFFYQCIGSILSPVHTSVSENFNELGKINNFQFQRQLQQFPDFRDFLKHFLQKRHFHRNTSKTHKHTHTHIITCLQSSESISDPYLNTSVNQLVQFSDQDLNPVSRLVSSVNDQDLNPSVTQFSQ